MHTDYLIIGAGPAGLQLGYLLERAGRSYRILEAGDAPGTFFATYPRHRRLISVNKVHTGYADPGINLRWDWNSLLSDDDRMLFKRYSSAYYPAADDLRRYMADFAIHFGLRITYGAQVAAVAKRDGEFVATTADGVAYSARCMVVASGVAREWIPAIPGIELAETYAEVSIDPNDFINQRVLILGKGNSAFETADNLIATAALIHLVSPNPLKLAWKSHYVGHLRAINNNILDTYQLKLQNALLDATVERIEQRDGKLIAMIRYNHANDEVEELAYDRVIACTGFRFDTSIFGEGCHPALAINDRFPAMTSGWESTNVPGLFFAGTLMQMRDFKQKQSGFIHGFRYNIQTLHTLLEQRYHGCKLPHRLIDSTSAALCAAIIGRINVTSSLWQQSGYLCDAVVVRDGVGAYHEDLPIDYIEEIFGDCDHYYTVMLDFGHERLAAEPDVFAITRVHKDDARRAEQSTALHPIIRRWSRGQLVAEHHVIEDLASEWREAVHVDPLHAFFEVELSPVAERQVAALD